MEKISEQNPRIIYITGVGHSGSTVLDLVLGSAPGTVSAGELKALKEYVAQADEMTNDKAPATDDSGKTAAESPIWQAIYEDQYSYISPNSERRRIRFFDTVRIVLGLRPRTLQYYNYPMLYQTIAKQATSAYNESVHTVIDSSKNLGPLVAVTQAMSPQQVYVIHLVRDIRGCVYSAWRRSGKFSALVTVKRWVWNNICIRAYLHKNYPKKKVFYLSYEKLTQDPGEVLTELNNWVGLHIDVNNYPEIVRKKTSYRFAGNSMRTKKFTGITDDCSWQVSLPMSLGFLLWPLNLLFK